MTELTGANAMEIFNFDDDVEKQVRVIVDGKGEPWFVAKDVAEILGYALPRKAVLDHCVSALQIKYTEALLIESSKMERTTGRGGLRANTTIKIIPIGDVCRLIVGSKLPSAQRFERWVFDEVLPTILKHGVYATPVTLEKMLDDPDTMISMLNVIKEERKKRAEIEQENATLKPKALVFDTHYAQGKVVSACEFVRTLDGIDKIKFKRRMAELGYFYKLPTRSTYRVYSKYLGPDKLFLEKHHVRYDQFTVRISYVLIPTRIMRH